MKNISFDIASLIMLSLLFCSVFLRKMTSGLSNRIFHISVLCAMISTAFNIFSAVYDNMPVPNPVALCITHTGYLMFHNMQAPLQLFFVISLTDTWHKVKKNPVTLFLLLVPYTLVFLALATNPFTGLVFTTAEGYRHGTLFYGLYGSFLCYLVLDAWYIVRYRAQLGIRKILALSSMAVYTLVAVIVHLVYPEQLVECLAVTLALFTISIAIQRPEDFIDSFTGLLKQSAYADNAKRAFENGKHWHVVMLNIGNYNSVQSMVGFDFSVEILQKVADRLRQLNNRLGKKAVLYYLDRGRYRAVFSENERHIAEQFAEHIQNELKLKIRCANFDVGLTPYVILARCPEEIESFKSLMAFGSNFHEFLPYHGKVMQASEVYDPKDYAIRNNIDAIIERGLDTNKFEVYYQPIYSISEGKFKSAEALLRLNDEDHGFISPEILIPAAEQSGAIIQIGDFVLEQVCKFIAGEQFRKLGLEYIEVNLSVAQCMHADLAEKIIKMADKYGVSPDKINLEITETAASYGQRVMTDNLDRLSEAGFTFSLDDYGTGYSNLKRVASMPLKIVKLDKSFVDEQNNPKMWILMQDTVKMLKDMNMEIVVEGIETEEMVEAFSELKCDFIQGYFFSKPINSEEFVNFILANQKKD